MCKSLLALSVYVAVIAWGPSAAVSQDPQAHNHHNHDHTAVLNVKQMCCDKESAPAIRELSKVPGVARVVADHKARTLTIVPKGNSLPAPFAIWEAAEKARVEPVQLRTAHGVFKSKPRR